MGLDKPPPSRYRIEEKDGRLIVHDSMASDEAPTFAPAAQPRSALDGLGRAAPTAPEPVSPGLARPPNADAGKTKRVGTVTGLGIGLALFLIVTNLWPMFIVAMLIPPIRKQLLGSVLPAVKRFVDEGRVG